MHAHKIRIVVGPGTNVVVQLPLDFPAGMADVIVLSDARPAEAGPEPHGRSNAARLALLQALADRFPVEASLGPVIFHEDPASPLDEDDWPAGLRP
jgi:hypothetical protein